MPTWYCCHNNEIVQLVGYAPVPLFEYNALTNALKCDIEASEAVDLLLEGTLLAQITNQKLKEIIVLKNNHMAFKT